MARNDRTVRLEVVKRALAESRRGIALKTLSEKHNWKLRNLYRDIDAFSGQKPRLSAAAGGAGGRMRGRVNGRRNGASRWVGSRVGERWLSLRAFRGTWHRAC
jgi:hypothetical protein